MPVDPQLADMLAFMESAGYPRMEEGSPETARKGFRAMSVDLVKPEDVVPVAAVETLEVAGRAARLYRAGTDPAPTVLFLHGGGFVVGDLETHDQTCRRLCRDTGATVLSVDYRVAPEHPFPAAVDDVLAAAAWTLDHLDELGGTDVLAVAGDSAGGNLSAIVAQAHREAIAAQLLIYPAVDALGDYGSRVENAEGYFLTRPLMEWFFVHYVTGVSDLAGDDPRIAPLHGDLAGLPPAVVVTAEFDPLRDEGEAYAAALTAAGTEVDLVRYDGLIHGFVDMVSFSAACAEAVADMNARFGRLLHA